MLSSETYWKESVWMFCKSLLPFLTFVNCEGPYLVEGFLRNLCPCFDIVFAPLGLITRTSNNIVEIAVTSECYLIMKIVGNYTMNFRSSFPTSIRSVYIENWREVAHDTQSAQIAQK